MRDYCGSCKKSVEVKEEKSVGYTSLICTFCNERTDVLCDEDGQHYSDYLIGCDPKDAGDMK